MIDGKTGGLEPSLHRLVVEAEADMGVAGAKLFPLVSGEIDHQQPPAQREDAARLRDRDRGRVGVVQNLVDDEQFNSWILGRTPAHRWGTVQDLAGPAVWPGSSSSTLPVASGRSSELNNPAMFRAVRPL